MGEIKKEAISVNMYYRGGGGEVTNPTVDEGTPVIEKINFNTIQIDICGTAIEVAGLPESYIRDIKFTNVTAYSAEQEKKLKHTERITFHDTNINGKPVH